MHSKSCLIYSRVTLHHFNVDVEINGIFSLRPGGRAAAAAGGGRVHYLHSEHCRKSGSIAIASSVDIVFTWVLGLVIAHSSAEK